MTSKQTERKGTTLLSLLLCIRGVRQSKGAKEGYSVINYAKVIRSLQTDCTITSFREYLWSFVDKRWVEAFSDIPSKTKESEAMRNALKKYGFKFVGPTTYHAFMQRCGFVIRTRKRRGWRPGKEDTNSESLCSWCNYFKMIGCVVTPLYIVHEHRALSLLEHRYIDLLCEVKILT